jgi:hypothetical protein
LTPELLRAALRVCRRADAVPVSVLARLSSLGSFIELDAKPGLFDVRDLAMLTVAGQALARMGLMGFSLPRLVQHGVACLPPREALLAALGMLQLTAETKHDAAYILRGLMRNPAALRAARDDELEVLAAALEARGLDAKALPLQYSLYGAYPWRSLPREIYDATSALEALPFGETLRMLEAVGVGTVERFLEVLGGVERRHPGAASRFLAEMCGVKERARVGFAQALLRRRCAQPRGACTTRSPLRHGSAPASRRSRARLCPSSLARIARSWGSPAT